MRWFCRARLGRLGRSPHSVKTGVTAWQGRQHLGNAFDEPSCGTCCPWTGLGTLMRVSPAWINEAPHTAQPLAASEVDQAVLSPGEALPRAEASPDGRGLSAGGGAGSHPCGSLQSHIQG